MNKTYKSEVFASIHETVSDLHDIGLVDKQTMKRFDESCLTPVEKLRPEEIKAIREKEHASQSVFALHLNVSTSVVSQGKRGERTHSGASLKLLCIVKRRASNASLERITAQYGRTARTSDICQLQR